MIKKLEAAARANHLSIGKLKDRYTSTEAVKYSDRAWWAVLFTLSLLARYQPDTWTRYLDVDSSAYAERLETLLDRALVVCPQLLLHAIRSVS